MDCFLFEGSKVLFRICLGILRLNERLLLSLSDPVALFQFLKEIAKHTFDIEALFNVCYKWKQARCRESKGLSRES